MASEDVSLYKIPSDTPVNKLDCSQAFKGLTDQEKRYAHHFSRAGWEGALICLLQTSPESPGILSTATAAVCRSELHFTT